MSDIVYDSKMSDAEGLMWRLEKDPQLSSTFGTVTLLDRAPDFALFTARLLRATLAMPRLRQRVQTAPGNIGAPTWVNDSDFDINMHVRRIALPKPGTERQLFDLASLICADPFDRSRPLWQFTVIEGLKGNRAAIVQKLHHTIADGESGVQLSLKYLDFERDVVQPITPNPDEIDSAREDLRDADTKAADAVRDVLASGLRFPLEVAKQVKELLADPGQLPDASNAAADTFRGIVSQLSDTEAAHSPLWTDRSARRRIEHATAPFDDTKAAATALGGTLNTAFMTIATEAASRYHVALDAPVDFLRSSMATKRFRAIQNATAHAIEDSSNTSLDALAALASAMPTSLITRLARQQAQTVDFATSNVRGAPVPLYVAGARLLHNIPIGPLSGVAFNLTLLSYDGHLDMGLNTDAAAVTEPELLRACLTDSIAAFTALAG